MSTDGILEYQGTKRVLYRGDTSNIVFDTRTTSLGIGVTGSNNPSSNLYITGNAYVSSNLAIGGVMTMGVVNVAARHNLQAVTDMGNVTTHTIEFTNPTTSLVASGNVEVGGNVEVAKELTVSGNVEVAKELTVSGNVEVGTANLFVDTTHSRIGIGTVTPNVLLELSSDTGSATIVPTELRLSTTTIAGDWDTTNPWGKITFYSADTSNSGPKVRGAIGMSPLEIFGGYGRLGFFTDHQGTLGERMSIKHDGNVGIATTSPVATLHINGSLYNTAKIELLKRLVTITGGYNQLHPLQPGMQLYASDARNTWQQYQFASDSEWLIGTLGSDMVNGGSGTDSDMTISVKADVTAFLIRHTSGWSGVSTTGWSSIGTVAALMTGYTNNFEIWARTFSQGTHSMNTYSAMYAFTI